MILPLYASLERLDPRLVEAASDLYASPWQSFRRVTWPLSLPGVVAGTLLTFIPAAGDFINSRLLGNTQTVMIGQVIDSQFLRVLDYPLAAALSFILLILIVTLVALYVRRQAPRSWSEMRWIRRHLLAFAALAVLAYMLIPNIVVAVFSFNDPVGRYNYTVDPVLHRGLDRTPAGRRGSATSVGLSLQHRHHRIAGRHRPRHHDRVRPGRYRFHGREPTNLLIFMPMATPEVVMGSSLLTLFLDDGGARGSHRDPHRAHHVLRLLRRRRGQGTRGHARPAARGGGRRSRRQPAADVPAGDPAAGCSRHRCRCAARLLAQLRRLHHHQLQREPELDHVPHVRLGSGASAARRCRST